MLTPEQNRALELCLLRQHYLIPKLNEFGLKLLRSGYLWLKITRPEQLPAGCTFELYDIREDSRQAVHVLYTCVVISHTEDALIYRFACDDGQEVTIPVSDFSNYLVDTSK